MKKLILVILLIVGTLFLTNCKNPVTPDPDPDPIITKIWSDATSSKSILDFSNVESKSFVENKAEGCDENDMIYFRSSDIEFWSINSVDDIDTIHSTKYHKGDYSTGRSLECWLGDLAMSVAFSPSSQIAHVFNEDKDWNNKVNEFMTSSQFDGFLNFIRLDIGAGCIVFKVNGVEIDVSKYDSNDLNRIECNSILFVDEKFLSTHILITGSETSQINEGELNFDDFEISTEDWKVVEKIIKNCHRYDNETPIDVDGVLLMPITPYDVSSYDPTINSLIINIAWNMANCIYAKEDASGNITYYMEDRVQGICFDFEVFIEIVK